jgi:hypothetical protein
LLTYEIMPPKDVEAILQISIALKGSKPAIWRRVLVPFNFTLTQLHSVIQESMGWWVCHLHGFRIGQERYTIPEPGGGSMGMNEGQLDERKARLYLVLGAKGAKAIYNYDFGDGWEHLIVVEKVLMPEAGVSYPVCVGGKRGCPPEDCGGMWGYYALLRALNGSEHARHEELTEWIGSAPDPEAFSLAEANESLESLQKRRRAKA